MTDRTEDIWGPRTKHRAGTQWPRRVDVHLADGCTEDDVERWVRSACVLCSNGCGLDIAVADGKMVGVRGLADDRVNRGRLGPKGLYGWQGQNGDDRLRRPQIRGAGGRLVEANWEDAMALVASTSRRLLDEHGPLSHGFYTSGQLMLEEYYTIAAIAKGGIGTPHTDGNTRLCTATAAAALKESFGTDGQPGSYADIEHCDALFLYGHNAAETQTVLWARMLDRLDGADPPSLVCVDPRRTPVAARADVHLAVRPGTNLALMNALAHELVRSEAVDQDWVTEHTLGFGELCAVAEHYPPERAAEVCGVDAESIRRAARIFAHAERPLSTVLQGFYQSHQATAASCAVNNLHLLRGALGRAGAGVLQMNGQPTAQNNRECGGDGDLPGFRNWANIDHVRELARLWDVDAEDIPHWGPPTHAMQMFRYAEQGSLRFLWVAGTNPAVSLPELPRIRDILGNDETFLVVSDAYPTETTEFADVVLPAALWGEKTGTFTNADRTVHLAERAVRPPGEARSDLDIWVEYARRLDLRTRSGRPLPWWSTPEEAFDEWRRCSAGRPCDYTAMSYQRLREEGELQWPCTAATPGGTERLYVEPTFGTETAYCENYGHDLDTGATTTEEQHRAMRPAGRAMLKTTHYAPPPTGPNEDYPFSLNTGRSVHHFHTRTKTGRSARLRAAEPKPWVELAVEDAESLGVAEGDIVRVSTPRAAVRLPARLRRARAGTVFIPFHFGHSIPGDADTPTAANELTATAWDPVSKQPTFKVCGARIDLDTGEVSP